MTLTYTNPITHPTTSFNEYLALPGYSHSWLKQQRGGIVPEFKSSEKVAIGKIVDAILTSGVVDFSSPLYPEARRIANLIRGYLIERFGEAFFRLFKPQTAITATIHLDTPGGTFAMPTKGILDWLWPDRIVIDLKVTWEKDVDGLIAYMRYDNQLWGYGKLAQVPQAFILIHSVPLEQTFLKPVALSGENEFWENAVLEFGTVREGSAV